MAYRTRTQDITSASPTLGSICFIRNGVYRLSSEPLIQHLNGDQSQAGYRIKVGIVRSFYPEIKYKNDDAEAI